MTEVSNEHAEALADRDWWQAAGDVVGLKLSGWTYRTEAKFFDGEKTVNLPGSVAERLISLRQSHSTGAVAGASGEWHRADSERSILLYTLKQDGWRKGEPAMVNDLMVRIENAPHSDHDLGPIADQILSSLNGAKP